MERNRFRSTIVEVLTQAGFAERGGVYCAQAGGVTTLARFEQGCGTQDHVALGIWLRALSGDAPRDPERCHLYCRLEGLVPELREVILAAGDAHAPDNALGLMLLAQESTTLAELLRAASAMEELRRSVVEGKFRGRVRHEAREFLKKKTDLHAAVHRIA
jgi:hypothetical protein